MAQKSLEKHKIWCQNRQRKDKIGPKSTDLQDSKRLNKGLRKLKANSEKDHQSDKTDPKNLINL